MVLKIKGVAIVEGLSRNKIKYIGEELEPFAPTLINCPILLDHKNETLSSIGKVTNSVWNKDNKKVLYEGWIKNPEVEERINDGRITHVSVGAVVGKMVEEKAENGEVHSLARNMVGCELSTTPVPGIIGASVSPADRTVNPFENYNSEIIEKFKVDNSLINDIDCFVQNEMGKKIKEGNKEDGECDCDEEKIDEAEKKFGFEPPESGDAPKEVKDILAHAYASARKTYDDKTKCSKIAWGAVANAGWEKDKEGKWKKKESIEVINIETIKKVNGGWQVWSKDGSKPLSKVYDSEDEAKKRLKEIEFFKHKKECYKINIKI